MESETEESLSAFVDLTISEDECSHTSAGANEKNGAGFDMSSGRTRRFLPRRAKLHKTGLYAESKDRDYELGVERQGKCPTCACHERNPTHEEATYSGVDKSVVAPLIILDSSSQSGHSAALILDSPSRSENSHSSAAAAAFVLDSPSLSENSHSSAAAAFVLDSPPLSENSHSSAAAAFVLDSPSENSHSSRFAVAAFVVDSPSKNSLDSPSENSHSRPAAAAADGLVVDSPSGNRNSFSIIDQIVSDLNLEISSDPATIGATRNPEDCVGVDIDRQPDGNSVAVGDKKSGSSKIAAASPRLEKRHRDARDFLDIERHQRRFSDCRDNSGGIHKKAKSGTNYDGTASKRAKSSKDGEQGGKTRAKSSMDYDGGTSKSGTNHDGIASLRAKSNKDYEQGGIISKRRAKSSMDYDGCTSKSGTNYDGIASQRAKSSKDYEQGHIINKTKAKSSMDYDDGASCTKARDNGGKVRSSTNNCGNHRSTQDNAKSSEGNGSDGHNSGKPKSAKINGKKAESSGKKAKSTTEIAESNQDNGGPMNKMPKSSKKHRVVTHQRMKKQRARKEKSHRKPDTSNLKRTPKVISKISSTRLGQEKEEFNKLFEKILMSAYDFRIKGCFSADKPTYENEVPWDPIIFHEDKQVEIIEEVAEDRDPFESLWHDMHVAFKEMNMKTSQSHCHCKHEAVFDEDIGYYCKLCHLVIEEIEQVMASFEGHKAHNNKNGEEHIVGCEGKAQNNNNGTEEDMRPVVSRKPIHFNLALAWAEIEELKFKMRDHQIDGFEFLWKNVVASFDKDSKAVGGCILAHAPGTGKSMLLISFLKSFMGLNSWCRPLIVAPKNMVLPWQNEFKKWSPNINIHLLNHVQSKTYLGYLKVISDWYHSTSVLIVAYSLFSKLTDEDMASKKPECEKVGKLLLYTPDLLIMDEGHVPRSFLSKLRRSVLQVRTRSKILVSGTLFQNNVRELFNSLYLVCPNFLYGLNVANVSDRLGKLDMENMKHWQTYEEFQVKRTTAEEESEARSRKLFMDEIGHKLDSMNGEAFKAGIQKYKSLTSCFVHSYDGEILNTLPGIKESIVLLQASPLQEEVLKTVENLDDTKFFSSEVMNTIVNIHPSLLLMMKCSKNISSFDVETLKAVRKDPKHGVKVQFILEMANCCQSRNEKLLVFCQYIEPLLLLQEMLEEVFQVFVITGKQKMIERDDTMKIFNDAAHGTQILLASLTACGEGINLTGASRVVFLDMHWNPSRMRQAASRAFRLGQKKVVYTYWLIVRGEKEEHKYRKIQNKDLLSQTIISKQEISAEELGNANSSAVMVGDDILEEIMRGESSNIIISVVKRSYSEEEGKLSVLSRR